MRHLLAFSALSLLLAAAHAAEPTPTVSALLRVLKADGSTVAGQAAVTSGGAMAVINVRAADALVAANGRCAFNVRYDEVSNSARKGTTNRLYSNDTLVAQNTAIDLQPGVLRSITTQPYLFAGGNNVKVVLDADGKAPVTGWVRVNVDGTCTAASAAPPKTAAPPEPPKPAAPPVAPVTPGSASWNTLYNAWGYSNYGVTQLKGKGYARYADLTAVNADLTKTVNAKTIAQTDYDKLMARWNAIANDAAFKAAMAAIVPGKPGVK